MRSDAVTEPPGLSMRTTSAFSLPLATPFSIARAMVSPPAVPGPARPSMIVPAIVTTPIGPLTRGFDMADIIAQRDAAKPARRVLVFAAKLGQPLLELRALTDFGRPA